MKLPEFLQTAYRKVIEWLLCPVLALQIVKPSDQVENPFVVSPATLDRGHNFLHIVLLALFNVVYLSEYLRGVRCCSVFTGSVGFE